METQDLFAPSWTSLWAEHQPHAAVGAVFTRPEIVALILDLAGYCADGPRLAEAAVLEPSCGDGAFLTQLLSRLIESERRHRAQVRWDDPALSQALRAADIDQTSVATAREAVCAQLGQAGCPPAAARALAQAWIVQTDFLLHRWPRRYDFVVGNPPYVRIEDLPKAVLARYRDLYQTTGDRADLYVAFIERGLELLSPGGVLAFITANRFAKNLYGRRLRKLLAQRFHVRHYLNLEHTQPFLTEVSAYPAVLVVDQQRGGPTRAATLRDVLPPTLSAVRQAALGTAPPDKGGPVTEFPVWYPDGGPWLTTCTEEHGELRRLDEQLPVLEESAPGTRVGIGVATGADQIFILGDEVQQAEIEPELLLPLLMVRDIGNQGLDWSGRYLLNPFEEDGGLVDLRRYPRLARYLQRHEAQLRGRHVARTRPKDWYRTIDRIWPALLRQPKLVIPDIQPKEATTIGLDEGAFYPHHNVYFVTSHSWDLRALRALLRSQAVSSQVRAYSVQLRGGSVRWQAQTLRRIRLPPLAALSQAMLQDLIEVSDSPHQHEIDAVAARAFAVGQR